MDRSRRIGCLSAGDVWGGGEGRSTRAELQETAARKRHHVLPTAVRGDHWHFVPSPHPPKVHRSRWRKQAPSGPRAATLASRRPRAVPSPCPVPAGGLESRENLP